MPRPDGLSQLEPELPPDQPVCELCRGAGFVRPATEPYFTRSGLAEPVPCECQKGRMAELHAERIRILRAGSRLPAALQRCTFANLDPWHVDVYQMLRTAKTWVQQQIAGDNNGLPWLCIIGGSGNGKSHVAAAATSAFVEAFTAALYLDYLELMDDFRGAYHNDSAYYDRLVEARSAGVLVLDDIFAGKVSDWCIEQVDKLVNYRYARLLPTMLVTNLGLDELKALAPRAADRLRDAAVCEIIVNQAPSYRERNQRKE